MFIELVERHIIKKRHKLWQECDRICFASKNLYNQGLYQVRQHFFKTGQYLNYNLLQKQFQDINQVDYRNLPAKVSQQVLKNLDQNFRSFFRANQSYKKNPKLFQARPRIPRYKDKIKGRNITIYTNQAVSKKALKQGLIQLSKTTISLRTKQSQIQQVRIVPKYDCYVIEVVYKVEEKLLIKNDKAAAIDLGINNLAAITFNVEVPPIIVNGKPLKSINQYYNKKKAELMSYVGDKGTSNRIKKLTFKRNNKVQDYLHKSSRYIINQLVLHSISTLIIGWNEGIKQDINIGKGNNQNFVHIPFKKLIEQLQYKGRLEGIKVIVREESYTSKCSFLDNEPIQKHNTYLGKRVKRGLFKTGNGQFINADVNASYNIMKKEIPNVFADGIEGVVVHPVRVNPCKLRA